MPHCIVEYARDLSEHIDISDTLHTIHNSANNTGLFNEAAIKVRAIPCDHYLVGGKLRPFIHVTAKILDGRTTAQKSQLSQALLQGLQTLALTDTSLTVEVVDMDQQSYGKIA